ncbi:MAG: group II intron reverse transcriptase/maturase [Desulfuromonadales bacterium]|nr:group II intron reverse transcriptase/maturase [Desulfuromonadales bacterium]
MAKIYHSLYDRMLYEKGLLQAFAKVKSNKGAPGVDGQSIEGFAEHLSKEIALLEHELRQKSYHPQPVKRVEIPKPGGGKRLLGIPTVRDRVVQQALLNILQPIFDPEFHPSSYGYRPGRSPHQAVAKASQFIRLYGLKWVADMDVSRCFDTLNHALILKSFRRKIADGSILELVRMFLQGGVMTGEGWQASETGSPQGGVISPLIANVYLDAFDQFMKGRGYRIVRFADDILILTRSKSAAHNALNVARNYLEGTLLLTVNEQKSHVVHSFTGVNYLGVEIHTGYTRIKREKVREFKDKVRRITRRNSPVNLKQVISDLSPVVRGFANYFRVANCQGEFKVLAQWVRRRLRAKQLCLWKRSKRLHRRLRQLGYQGEFKAIKMNSWRNSASNLASHAIPGSYLRELGLFELTTVQTGYLPQNF